MQEQIATAICDCGIPTIIYRFNFLNRTQIVHDSLLLKLMLCMFMILKGMKITNQLLYQLSYKGSERFINNNLYFAIQIKLFCSQLLLQLLAYRAFCSLIVTNKSYSNRTRNPGEIGISKFILFLRKHTATKGMKHDTKE
tara:strand:+ start:38 stop:457 length:420 start_codon:yes stop_codon:yes gene_type:complete